MEDNQYFFSNEEGSNDSNVNMIGGMNDGNPQVVEGDTTENAKDSNCREELSEINKKNSEITKIKEEKDKLMEQVRQLSNILITYEDKFKEFGETKKVLDTNLQELENILTVEEAQIVLKQTKDMMEKKDSGLNETESDNNAAGPPNAGPPNALN